MAVTWGTQRLSSRRHFFGDGPRGWEGSGQPWSSRRNSARYEADFYEPKIRAFAALARALGVTMEVLLYGEEEAARIADERPPGADARRY